jgi:hypothetical protein
MTKYAIYITSDNGNGVTMRLEDYDGESIRDFRLAAFARDAVLTIEPEPITSDSDDGATK